MCLSHSAIALAAVLLIATSATADDYWVYLGTYTTKDGSKGIYRSKFDNKTGKLSEPELAAELESPSFLAVHPTGKSLYAVGETNAKDGGPVVAYSLDPKTGKLTKLNEDRSGGAAPCQITVHPRGDLLAVANYTGGSTALFEVDKEGKLAKRLALAEHSGSSVNTSRQKEPHAHCVAFAPESRLLLAVDLGIDKVKVFDTEKKKLDDGPKDIDMPAGTGPRHIAIAPDGKFAYVCGELNSTVNVVKLGLSDGTSKVVQTLSTLPEPVKGNSTAECVLHPSGKFVYVSNRGHNSIAVFGVG